MSLEVEIVCEPQFAHVSRIVESIFDPFFQQLDSISSFSLSSLPIPIDESELVIVLQWTCSVIVKKTWPHFGKVPLSRKMMIVCAKSHLQVKSPSKSIFAAYLHAAQAMERTPN